MLGFAVDIDEPEEERSEPEKPFNKGCQDQGGHQCYVNHL